MIESFVDLTYRGLPLGKRVKLTQVRPSTGYVETPAPMPVGTAIQIATDDGVMFDALVMTVHEQVGGSDRPPGMIVQPALEDEARKSWWKARVALPEEPPASTRVKPMTVRPRSHTVPAPPPDTALAEAAAAVQAAMIIEPDDGVTQAMPVIDDEPPGSRTTVMTAIDPDLLERMTRTSDQITAMRTTGEHEVVDDGKQTMMMDAVDPAALGLDVGGSGPMAAASDDDEDEPPKSSSSQPGTGKKKKKKR